MSATTLTRQPSHLVSNRAAAFDAKHERELHHAELRMEKARASDATLPVGERITAACHVAIQVGNEAVFGVKGAINTALANHSENKVTRDLDRQFDFGPDVRSTDELHHQHCTTPQDVDPVHKDEKHLVENRKSALRSRQAAAEERIRSAQAHAEKESAENFSQKAQASIKEVTCSLRAKSHEATAAVRDRNAKRDARDIFPDQHE